MSGSTKRRRDVRWADGLRGIGACCVVLSHSTWAVLPQFLFPPNDLDNTDAALGTSFQAPFLVVAGQSFLPVFFIISGYVCAIKAIRLANAGLAHEARRHLASSALRRVVRTGLSASCGTLFAWTVCQARLFSFVPLVELPGMWLAWGTPKPSRRFGGAVKALVASCYTTFTTAHNDYEPNQWSLAYEMRGAMLISVCLTISVGFTPRGRRIFMLIMAIYFFLDGEYISPSGYFLGALLAEMAHWQIASEKDTSRDHHVVDRTRWWRWGVEGCAIGMLLVVLFLITRSPEVLLHAKYTRILLLLSQQPLIGSAPEKFLGALSSCISITAITLSPTLRTLLSHPTLLSLNQISFPLFLLHGTFIRGPLAWAFFVLLPWLHDLPRPTGVAGQGYYRLRCESWGCFLSATVVYGMWFMGLVLVCRVWARRVDSVAVGVSVWFERVVTGEEGVGEAMGRGVGRVRGWITRGGSNGGERAALAVKGMQE